MTRYVHTLLLHEPQHWLSLLQGLPGALLQEPALVPVAQQISLPVQRSPPLPHRHWQLLVLKVFPLVQAAMQVLLLAQKFGAVVGHSHWHVVALKNVFGAGQFTQVLLVTQ